MMELLMNYLNGLVLNVICSLGLIGNSVTLLILNSNRDMRNQPINIYLTFLAIYDNGVLFNAILMFGIPALKSLCSPPDSPLVPVTPVLTSLETTNRTTILLLEYLEGMNHSLYLNGSDGALTPYEDTIKFNDLPLLDFVNDDDLMDMSSPPSGDMAEDSEGIYQDPRANYIKIVYPLAMISQTGSIWTTCLITAERYFAIAHPLRAMTLSTRKRAIYALTILSVCAVVYNLSRFWEVDIVDDSFNKVIQPSDLRKNQVYYWSYYIGLHLVMLYIIPLSLLSILNTKIYLAIRRANRDRSNLTRQLESELNIASMLVLLVAIFIACNGPSLVVNFLEITRPNYFTEASLFANLLVCFNSSVNFLIYCIFGKKFRERLTQTFTCSRGPFASRSALRPETPVKTKHVTNNRKTSIVAETLV